MHVAEGTVPIKIAWVLLLHFLGKNCSCISTRNIDDVENPFFLIFPAFFCSSVFSLHTPFFPTSLSFYLPPINIFSFSFPKLLSHLIFIYCLTNILPRITTPFIFYSFHPYFLSSVLILSLLSFNVCSFCSSPFSFPCITKRRQLVRFTAPSLGIITNVMERELSLMKLR